MLVFMFVSEVTAHSHISGITITQPLQMKQKKICISVTLMSIIQDHITIESAIQIIAAFHLIMFS